MYFPSINAHTPRSSFQSNSDLISISDKAMPDKKRNSGVFINRRDDSTNEEVRKLFERNKLKSS